MYPASGQVSTAIWMSAREPSPSRAPHLSLKTAGIIAGMKEEAPAGWRERIVVDPAILVGRPIVKGTCIAVELVVDLLARGWTEARILESYRALTAEDIRACRAFADAIRLK